MTPVAHFRKVSFNIFHDKMIELFEKDGQEITPMVEESIRNMYDDIMLPIRATKGSAGYDFFTPAPLHIFSDRSIIVPTGICCDIDEGYVLSIYPRSGLGFKYRVTLDNTVGIIDSDYSQSDNEGHIILKLHATTEDGQPVIVSKGHAFAQGIFTQYFVTYEDRVEETRNGGFGSTTPMI